MPIHLDGGAITRDVVISVTHNFLLPLTVSLGLTLQDVDEMGRNENRERQRTEILFAALSGVFTASYQVKPLKLSMDWTGRVVGPQDLPTYEAPYQRATRSPWYTLQNLQATKQFGMSLSVYGGVKNLWNWTQPSPLIVWEEPFGDRFDTAYIYGPLQTRRFYLGVRWETSGKSHSR